MAVSKSGSWADHQARVGAAPKDSSNSYDASAHRRRLFGTERGEDNFFNDLADRYGPPRNFVAAIRQDVTAPKPKPKKVAPRPVLEPKRDTTANRDDLNAALFGTRAQVEYAPNTYLADAYAATEAMRNAERQRIEDDYTARQSEIRSRYALSETAEERRMLTRELADLERQRRQGHATINTAYGQSIDEANTSARFAARDGKAAGRAAYRGWRRAATDSSNLAVNALTGSPAADAAGRGPAQGAAAVVGDAMLTEGAQARQAAIEDGQTTAGVLRELAAGMAEGRAASIAELSQLNSQLRSDANRDHDSRVQSRITAETAAMFDALDSLANGYQSSLSALGGESRAAASDYALAEAGRYDDAVARAQQINDENTAAVDEFYRNLAVTRFGRAAAGEGAGGRVRNYLRRAPENLTTAFNTTDDIVDNDVVYDPVFAKTMWAQGKALEEKYRAALDAGDHEAVAEVYEDITSDPARTAFWQANGLLQF